MKELQMFSFCLVVLYMYKLNYDVMTEFIIDFAELSDSKVVFDQLCLSYI